jgi:hypothetical protein
MRLLVISFIASGLFLFSCAKKEQSKSETIEQQHNAIDKTEMAQMTEEQLIYYTCPMEEHKEVHSAEPGKCPECGMDLVAGVVTTEDKMEFYGCPMLAHSYVRSDTAGTCPDCGMELKPMRLVKPTSESM